MKFRVFKVDVDFETGKLKSTNETSEKVAEPAAETKKE